MKEITGRIITAVILLLGLSAVVLVGTPWSPYELGVVRTGSMSPALPSRSLIVVKVDAPQLHEPIVFQQYDGLTTHRWVGTNTDGTLRTKGDANDSDDTRGIQKADVVGGVVASVPQLGFWIIYLGSPYGIGSVLFGMISIWLLWSLIGRPSEKSEDQKNSLVPAT
jgi:signal peptidase